MAYLSQKELQFFNQLFESESNENDVTDTKMALFNELPQNLGALFKSAKLTLLAEVGVYQLWFPVEFKTDQNGQLVPLLSAPEVIDTKGIERSWRNNSVNLKSSDFIITSLSSTGVVLTPRNPHARLDKEQLLSFFLPELEQVTLVISPVRRTSKGIAAKIVEIVRGHDALRTFLFKNHKRQHASLYKLPRHEDQRF